MYINEIEGTTGSVFVTARMGAHQMSFESAISKDYDINTGEILVLTEKNHKNKEKKH